MAEKPKHIENDIPDVAKRARERRPDDERFPVQATDDPHRVRDMDPETCEKARHGESRQKKEG